MGVRVYIPILLLILYAVQYTETASINDLNEIKEGVKFAETMTTVMKPLEFTAFLVSAASKALSFISSTLKFVTLIVSHIGNSESPELLEIKRLYNEMNRRFDIVDTDFLDIKKLINWTGISNQLSQTESEIKIVSNLFKNIYTGPLETRESEKKMFLHFFKITCSNCALNLYRGIMGVNEELSNNNILKSAMTSLQYDRAKTQIFMLGIFKLLVLGVTNELAYRKLTFGEADYLNIQKQWEIRLSNVTDKIDYINRAIIRTFRDHSQKDTATFSMNNPTSILSNEIFSEKLYNYIVQKYDWRDWLVIVFKPMYGGEDFENFICDGFCQYRMYGRNILLSSVEKSHPSMNTAVAEKIISGINTNQTRCHPTSRGYCLTRKDYAYEVFNSFSLEQTKNCSAYIYASMGVINPWVDLWYQGKSNRLVYHRTPGSNSYSIHLFG